MLCSCGAGQQVLSVQATTIMETQPARFSFYETEHARCMDESEEFEQYEQCMVPARHVARAVDSYASSLGAAQAALNASGEDAFEDMMPCLIVAAGALVEALADANVPVPDDVSNVAGMASAFGGSCNE